MIDNGWTAAKGWDERQDVIADLLRGAGKRPVAIVPTATSAPVTLLDAGEAGRMVRELKPQPWPGDRMAAAATLARAHFAAAPQIFWLSDGIEDGQGRAFRAALEKSGRRHCSRPMRPTPPWACCRRCATATAFRSPPCAPTMAA